MKLFTLVFVPLVSAGVVRTQGQQVPMVEDVGSQVDTTVPLPKTVDKNESTVGIHFTASYAIASARYSNGTIRDLGKVVGDAEYVDLMSRWANGEDDITRACKDVQSLRCNESTLERQKRHHAGLPISPNAELLSIFMKKVRTSFEEELGEPIRTISPVFPRLSMYLWVDIRSAIKHADLDSTRRRNEMPVYEESNAAYAALSHGLCTPLLDCKEYPNSKKAETVLYLNFDNSSFSVGAMSLKTPFELGSTFSYGVNTKLGWWNLPVFTIPRAEFWAHVQEMIAAVVRSMDMAPNKVILMGEHGADGEFKKVVEAAVWEVLEFDVEMMLGAVNKGRVAHLAARGAAEMGFRDEESMRHNEALRRAG